MKLLQSRVVWGMLLIVGGILLLLQNLQILPGGNIFWAILFGLAGILFLSWFFSNRANWWFLIPGITFLDLALILLLEIFLPGSLQGWIGPIFLGCFSLAFFLVYLAYRQAWWAVIPGGVLLTLAVISGLDVANHALETGGIFFLGLGLTFALVGILPGEGQRLRWAFIPATVLVIIGIFISAAAGAFINYIWPAALILVGLFLLFRRFIFRREL